ncbi:hypothetical protein [Flavobacterium rivuli]|nr:hypothetical protein [Flavobacterium rivuli]
MTEDKAVLLLVNYLENRGWKIDGYCLGQTKGCDITANKNFENIKIEVKGSRAGDLSPTRKRKYFDRGQIKTHFGRAIVKILEDKYKNPACRVAIAHPFDNDIISAIGHLIPFLKKLEIEHFWIYEDGKIEHIC